jgi:hypothetical protein
VFPESLRPELSGTLDEGGVLEANKTSPGLTQDKLPGGGVFKAPDTNLTFSQTNNSSNTSTLGELQSEVENDTFNNIEETQDEEEDLNGSNEEKKDDGAEDDEDENN